MNRSADTQIPQKGEIGVLGAGAWGTALAAMAARNGARVLLWAFEPEVSAQINAERRNQAFLAGVALPDALCATTDIAAAARSQIVIAATPAQHLRATLRDASSAIAANAIVVLCAKGIEQHSLALMSEVLAAEAPHARAVVLSGPGFAKDVARGLPTAVTIASADPEANTAVVAALGSPTFRPYSSSDLIGAQIGGAVKNVIAIACGVAEGRRLGEGARAALITRGFAEMCRLGLALGAASETMHGLAGLGDLVLTCVSASSRNTSFGIALGAGASIESALADRRAVVEGAASAPAVAALALRAGVDMPICAAVNALLAGAVDVEHAIADLLSRPFRAEGL